MKVLLLCSYCDDDTPGCTADLPCLDCLKMCNIVTMRGRPTDNLGSWDFNHDLLASGKPDRASQEAALITKIRAEIRADMEARRTPAKRRKS